VVLVVFPPYRRALLTGTFLAGGAFGVVLGVALGGVLTAWFGWRWSFGVMALLGLALTGLHWLVVSDRKVTRYRTLVPADAAPDPTDVSRARLTGLVRSGPLVCAYLGRPAAVRGRSAHHVAADLRGRCLRADRLGLADAMRLVPLVSVAVVVLLTGRRLDTRASRDGLRPAGVGLPEHGRTVRGG
jgi:MFS family permease